MQWLNEIGCILYYKDTNLKANHNHNGMYRISDQGVFYITKILI